VLGQYVGMYGQMGLIVEVNFLHIVIIYLGQLLVNCQLRKIIILGPLGFLCKFCIIPIENYFSFIVVD